MSLIDLSVEERKKTSEPGTRLRVVMGATQESILKLYPIATYARVRFP